MEKKSTQWRKNFDEQLIAVQLRFNSFFPAGTIHDFFTVKEDDDTGMLTIVLTDTDKLPNEIEEALLKAFSMSMPA